MTDQELSALVQQESLKTSEAQTLHNEAVMRFNATLQAASELSVVTVNEIATTNSSITEAISEEQKLNETVTDLRAQLQALQPVDCVLAAWTKWGECDAKCDSGKRQRSRKVLKIATNDGQCSSELQQEEPCLVERCAVCGDGKLNTPNEQCDSVEGCSEECTAQPGWTCAGNTCGRCGNGKIEASEECDDGEVSSSDGCGADCKIETGFVCSRGALGRSNCTQLEDFSQKMQQGITVGQMACQDSTMFVPTDFTDGTGECRLVPAASSGAIFSVSAAEDGDLLSLAAASATASFAVMRASNTPEVVAAPTLERSSSHHAQCRASSAAVCLAGAQHTRQCVRYATAECLELVMDERFCDPSREDHPGHVELRTRKDAGLLNRAMPVCVFAKCQLPATWLTGSGAPLAGVDWCVGTMLAL